MKLAQKILKLLALYTGYAWFAIILSCVLPDVTGHNQASDFLYKDIFPYVLCVSLAANIGHLFVGAAVEEDEKVLRIKHKVTGAECDLPAHYESEAVDNFLNFIDEQEKELAHRNAYLPDEAYLPTGTDYEKHYFDLVNKLTDELSPFVGGMYGPHPAICSICEGGPCKYFSLCTSRALWIDTPEDIIYLVKKKLQAS